MKKFTLLLGLALLWGGTNVVAEEVIVTTYSALNSAVDKAKTAATAVVTAQQAYDNALAIYNNWPEADKKIPVTTTITANAEYKTFVSAAAGAGVVGEKAVIYVAKKSGLPKSIVFYTSALKDKVEAANSFTDIKTLSLSLINGENAEKELATLNDYAVGYGRVLLFYSTDGVDHTSMSYAMTTLKTGEENANAAYLFLATWDAVGASVPFTKSGDPVENPAYTKAESDVKDAKDALDKAKKDASVSIKLEANITDFANNTIAELPANCTVDGAGFSIKSSSALFEINKGVIRNLANPDGLIAVDNEGTMRYCLEKTTPTTFRTYVSTTNYKDQQNVSLAEVIYGLNGFLFGYDVVYDIIKPSTPLYQAYYASATNKTLYSFYVNVVGDKPAFNKGAFKNATKVDSADVYKNAILYIDANVKVNGENIAVKSNGAYTSASVKLTEETEFYIPMNVIAEKFSYKRNFKVGYSSVCLPFAMPLSDNLTAYQFSHLDQKEGTMWFRAYSTAAANTPYLINSTTGGQLFADMTDVDLVATPAQLLTEIGDVDFCGVYKRSLVSDLIQNADYAVYGIADGKLVKASSVPGNSDILNPFRSYVYCKTITEAAGAPSYKIGLLEDDDNETGVETVATDGAETIGVKGGENAVEVTTDKACKVNVYSMNGMLVMSENVEAGTTTLPVKAGMYVVNGVKVIVK